MRLNIQPHLISFLSRESPKELKRMIGLSIFVGLTNTAIIGLINMAASDVTAGKTVVWQFFAFAFMLTMLMFGTRRANDENIRSTQDLIYRYKVRIMSDVFRSNLSKIDEIGRERIMEILARDTQSVSQCVGVIVTSCQSIATLLFLTIYMATVSMTAFFIISLSSVFIFVVGVAELFKVTGQLQAVSDREAAVNAIYADFLNGYKEIKMNSSRAFEITRDMVEQSKEVNNDKGLLIVAITNFFNYLQILLYVIVGIMVFIVPVISSDFYLHVTTAATTALFLAGSLSGIMMSIPNLSLGNVAAKTLEELAENLAISAAHQPPDINETFTDVQSIQLENITYIYGGKDASKKFALGPIDYQFDVGKIYFIRGNNGSGKSTLMRIVTGLYQPDSGRILVNGAPISEPTSGSYRDLFAVVFSDFHLFKKLYGLPASDMHKIEELLKLFKMQDKVTVRDGQFSDLHFSTGQRKRLALIVALLENRPFIILDEWAADQDPLFRQEFYENIIPKLRSLGKTVIAITHDDHYFEIADHVLYMENGKPIHP